MRLNFFRVAGAGALALLALAACSGNSDPAPAGNSGGNTAPVAGKAVSGSFKGQQFSYAGNGGSTQQVQDKIFKDFARTVGAGYAGDGPPTTAAVQAQVKSGNVIWDIVDAPEVDLQQGCGTTYQKIDYTRIDTSQLSKFVPKQECGVPLNASPWTFAYNKDAWPQAPTSWADFFDLQKFPGKRAIYAGFPMQQIEAALLGAGKSPKDLSPPDVDLGYQELDKIKSQLIFYAAGSDSQQMMASKQIAACICWSGRVYVEIQNGAHWGLVETAPPILRMDYWSIPVGAKHTDLAYAAINYALGAEQGAYWQEQTGYPSMNATSKPNLDEAANAVNVFRPPFAPVTIDVPFWAGQLSAQMDRWTTWTSKK